MTGMFTIREPQHYDPAKALLSDMFRDLNKRATGTTQKDIARSVGLLEGKTEGQLEGLAAILNERRAKKYSNMTHMPILMGADLRRFYAAAAARYKEDHAIEDRDERSVAEAKMWVWIDETLTNHTFPDDLEERRIEERKRLVKAGEVEPDESDLAWLEAEQREAMEAMNKAKQLVDAARPKRRPIKDQPQA